MYVIVPSNVSMNVQYHHQLYYLFPVGGGIALLRHQQVLNQKNIQRIQTIYCSPLSGTILLVTVYDK